MYVEFEHLKPADKAELLSLLGEKRDGDKLYAGGTDILVDLRDRKYEVDRLIDIKRIPEFHEIIEKEDVISIGSAVTFSEITENPLVREYASVLADGAFSVGSVLIRNKATLAGNIETASPAGDGLNAAYGLGASVVLLSAKGERKIPIEEYVTGPRRTRRETDECIAAIEVPKKQWSFSRFFKVGKRNALAISVVSGVTALDLDGDVVKTARICLGSVAPTPVRIMAAEELLAGHVLDEERIAMAAKAVSDSVSPISDIRASADYRRYMAGAKVQQALEDCLKRNEVTA